MSHYNDGRRVEYAVADDLKANGYNHLHAPRFDQATAAGDLPLPDQQDKP